MALHTGADRTQQALPALALGVLALSFAAVLFRQAAPTHPLVMAGVRLALAAGLLSPLVVKARLSGELTGRVARAAALAGLFYGAHFGAWVTSLTLTSVAASVTLVTATPLLLAVAAIATGRDRPDRRHWWAIGLAVIGLAFIGGTDLAGSSDALAGDGLALAGCAAMAGYLLIARRQGESLPVFAFSGIACAVGAAVLLGGAVASGIPIAFETPQDFGLIVLSALIPQLIGHGLLTWALRHVRPTVVGLATVGEPVGATILAWIWLEETPGLGTAAGCAVTVCAVALAVSRGATQGTASGPGSPSL